MHNKTTRTRAGPHRHPSAHRNPGHHGTSIPSLLKRTRRNRAPEYRPRRHQRAHHTNDNTHANPGTWLSRRHTVARKRSHVLHQSLVPPLFHQRRPGGARGWVDHRGDRAAHKRAVAHTWPTWGTPPRCASKSKCVSPRAQRAMARHFVTHGSGEVTTRLTAPRLTALGPSPRPAPHHSPHVGPSGRGAELLRNRVSGARETPFA